MKCRNAVNPQSDLGCDRYLFCADFDSAKRPAVARRIDTAHATVYGVLVVACRVRICSIAFLASPINRRSLFRPNF
jgi:hypothetical protein